MAGETSEPEPFSISRQEVGMRAIAKVLATKEALGWDIVDMNKIHRNAPRLRRPLGAQTPR